jgi:hypothetical protein
MGKKTGTYEPMAMGKFNCRRWGKVIDVGQNISGLRKGMGFRGYIGGQ